MAKEDLDLDVEATTKAKKPGKMKWIIIGVAGLLFITAATMGALYFAGVFDGGDTGDTTEAVADEGAVADAEHGEATKDGKASPAAGHAKSPLIYQTMEPPFIVSFSSNVSVRFMQISMQVAARDAAAIERVKTHTPAIRNGLLMLYSSLDPTVLNTREGKEDLLKKSLEEVNRVLTEQSGSGGIESAFFTNFVMQ